MLFLITKFLIWCCEKTGRTFSITGTAGPEDVYLIRYYVIRSQYFNFFIHRFLRSDRDDLHDHPWNFFTYVVRGAYTERKWNEATKSIDTTYRCNYPDDNGFGEYWSNTLVCRKATDQHQVVVDRELKLSEKEDAALTICITGPTIRNWGFIKNQPLDGVETLLSSIETQMFDPGQKPASTKRVWVDWKEYLGLPPDAPGRG